MSSSKRDGGPPRQPEVPVIDDPPEPAPPKAPDLPPPVPDPPDVVASWYGSEDQHYADGYERASWQRNSAVEWTESVRRRG
jgi:hypothetical protein